MQENNSCIDTFEAIRRLRAHLNQLSIPGNRFTEPRGAEEKAAYIRATIEACHLPVKQHRFRAWGASGENLIVDIGEDRGQGQDTLFLGAHYDSVPGCPGANDNASGVACLLALCEHLSTLTSVSQALRVCFWDMEEVGKQGSYAYLRSHLGGTHKRAMGIVLDMIGWRSDATFSQSFPPGFPLAYPWLYLRSLMSLNRATGHFFVARRSDLEAFQPAWRLPRTSRLVVAPASLKRASSLGLCDSDHYSFWRLGFPAVLVTDSGRYRNSAYHTVNDQTVHVDDYAMLEVYQWLQVMINPSVS